MELKLGNTSKDSKYLELIKNAISLHADHPRHHGVKMQAHHVISAEGIKRSGQAKYLVECGYDINLLANLVFIPCTLQGACYLRVQPHRGNHIHPIEKPVDQDQYDDDLEPKSYHDMIARRVRVALTKLSSECPGKGKVVAQKVVDEMNKLSRAIVSDIQNYPAQAPLTSIARYYSPSSPIGCGNVDMVSQHKGVPCACERMHKNKQAVGQTQEGISYVKKDERYILEVGR